MNKFRMLGASLLTTLVLSVSTAVGSLPVMAAPSDSTVRVSGTVENDTSDVTLYLKTSDGVMQIRLDNSTDTSECRLLVVGSTVSADVYRGDDAYMHAKKLISGTATTVDTSNEVTVKGKVAAGTTNSLLYLKTNEGTMKIKLDGNTKLNGVGVLYVGKSLSVSVARGSDAYMHAISLELYTESSHPGAVSVPGIVASGTSQSVLYLSTDDGIMKVKIDPDTDVSAGRVLIPGNKVTAEVYRGSDAYMHASKIVGLSDSLSSNSTTTVRGAVSEGTTTSILHLLTEDSGGVMYIKIDNSTDMSRCGLLLEGQYLYVDVARGSDAYMHATKIVNPNYTPAAAKSADAAGGNSNTSAAAVHTDEREITGAPTEKSTDSILYLQTNEGTFEIRLDVSTEMPSKAFMTGHTTKATIYKSSDGYYHAEKVSDDQFSNNDAKVDSKTFEVRGTIGTGSSLNLLNLDTSDGTYKFKIDKGTAMNGVRYLREGRSLKVTAATSSDGYLHAVKIEP